MPRVLSKKKSKGGKKEYTCTVCREKIVPGEQYLEWSFRYGGTYRQHANHGYPKASQLTQSRKADVYAELEGAEDAIVAEGEWDIEDVVAALEQAAGTATDIADEYRSNADEHFGGGGPQAELADEMEEWAGLIEDAAQQLQGEEREEDEEMSDFADRVRQVVQEAFM